MADGSAGTPGSSSGKTPAAKDKSCPFCGQAFTSSSLGRHLDLYIKDKNPKPPDDVHDVEEIRRLRGSITRRQARTSHGRRDDSTPASSKATPIRDHCSPSAQKNYANNNHADGGFTRTYVNRPSWEATGVMNDLPPEPSSDTANHATRRILSGTRSAKGNIARKQDLMEIVDYGRAAELALKEVLESVKAANMRAHPPSPFEFNFFNLSFPEMYLQCLSPPRSLLAEPPKSHQLSWPIEPPGTEDCEALRAFISSKLQDWRRRREHAHFGLSYLQNGVNGHPDVHPDVQAMKKEEASFYEHLSTTHTQWTHLDPEARQKSWHHACAKAFAREQENHNATVQKLELAQQENHHLRAQIAQLTQRPWQSPELPQTPFSTLPLSRAALSHLPISEHWTYDALTSKWRERLVSARSTQKGLPHLDRSSPTPGNPQPNHVPNGRKFYSQHQDHHTPSTNSNHNNETNNSNGHHDSEHEDEDLADAPGDMDEDVDADADGELEHADCMAKGILDPHLRGGGAGGVDGADVQYGGVRTGAR